MAVTSEQLTQQLTEIGLKFRRVDDEDVALIFGGKHVSELKMLIRVSEKGEYVRVRSFLLEKCPADHANIEGVLLELADLNLKKNLVKFGWDPSDGEIVAETNLALEDAPLSTPQLRRLIMSLVGIVDEAWPTLQKAMAAKGKPSTPRPAAKPSPPSMPSTTAAAARPTVQGEVGGASKSSAFQIIMAIGVLLLGIAAVVGVVYWVFGR